MNHHQKLALWAADCAERVLANFGGADPRPRSAIEAARKWTDGTLAMAEARQLAFAAHAAAREAGNPAAIAAARAAGHAAATPHVAGHAHHAARYALKSVQLAGQDMANERGWQLAHMPIEDGNSP
jgi:hypothetical protein